MIVIWITIRYLFKFNFSPSLCFFGHIGFIRSISLSFELFYPIFKFHFFLIHLKFCLIEFLNLLLKLL
nr:MAG TPA: hypothetical protein [Bacteriophage sp.]